MCQYLAEEHRDRDYCRLSHTIAFVYLDPEALRDGRICIPALRATMRECLPDGVQAGQSCCLFHSG